MDRQRIDKWLWHARVVRTRAAAAGLAGTGKVRVNGARIDAASKIVRCGDVVTIALDRVRVLKVLTFCERRGDADAGRALYEDLSPGGGQAGVHIRKAEDAAAVRAPGTGRPTKRERRALDRWRSDHDI
ncbi:MAG: RNA-binding S4 domain-containing protein [Pseudorhodoplanes sp.]|nr:RNA-binding S4 domain-containing protein [Pseudorhodoplanes sp.]